MTANRGIVLQALDPTIKVFCDAGEENLEEKPTTGIVVMTGKSPLGWTAEKQPNIVLSSTESEYVALSSAAQSGLWFGKVLEFMGYHQCQPALVTDVEWVEGKENPADMLTKPVTGARFLYLRKKCRMTD